ncbi:hypothetical protein [Nonomuraea insulae]|uniref:Uncharacterized protein n=1 Tax=Nonomuraea insulae TaxID=1616787 RepID=A0ABW1CTX5_9ACTN
MRFRALRAHGIVLDTADDAFSTEPPLPGWLTTPLYLIWPPIPTLR